MDTDIGLAFVLFYSVLLEEGLVGVVNSQSGLIFVRQEFSYIFRSSSFENLSKKEFVVGFDMVIGLLCKGVLGVVASQKLSQSVQFDSVGSVIFVQNVEKFLQSREELPLFVSQIGQTINDEFVIGCGCEFPFKKWADASPSFLGRHQLHHGGKGES
jgi:hypothetical protein